MDLEPPEQDSQDAPTDTLDFLTQPDSPHKEDPPQALVFTFRVWKHCIYRTCFLVKFTLMFQADISTKVSSSKFVVS